MRSPCTSGKPREGVRWDDGRCCLIREAAPFGEGAGLEGLGFSRVVHGCMDSWPAGRKQDSLQRADAGEVLENPSAECSTVRHKRDFERLVPHFSLRYGSKLLSYFLLRGALGFCQHTRHSFTRNSNSWIPEGSGNEWGQSLETFVACFHNFCAGRLFEASTSSPCPRTCPRPDASSS